MLYIVATPIGNLDDLSIRQAKTLADSEIILAEDTRSAFKLLEAIKKRFDFKIRDNQIVRSFYKEVEYKKSFDVIKDLENGKIVSLISESGMPVISDPGSILLKEVIKLNIKFTVIPGPSAVISALILSGFNTGNFMFLGFLPKKNNELRKLIKKIQKISEVTPSNIFVAYLSMYRYIDSLKIMDELIPDADICICREMTKKFEEVIRGKPKELMSKKFKGELTLVLKLTH